MPKTHVIPTITRHVLLQRFENRPRVYFRRNAMEKRRLAEFTQVIQQFLFPKSVQAHPRISFGPPFKLADLEQEPMSRRIMPAVIQRVRTELSRHREWP